MLPLNLRSHPKNCTILRHGHVTRYLTHVLAQSSAWNRRRFINRLLCAAALAAPAPAIAQTGAISLPDQLITDDQGYDLLNKGLQIGGESLTIGSDPETSLEFHRLWVNGAWVHNYIFELNVTPSTAYESPTLGSISGIADSHSFSFWLNGSSYSDSSGEGKTISASGSGYILTLRDGTKINFDTDVTCTQCFGYVPGNHNFIPSSIVKPSGETIHLYHKVNPGSAPYYFDAGHRISSAVTSNGYELKFEYFSDSFTLNLGDPDYLKLQNVTGVGLTTYYCDPQADHCSGLPSYFPRLSYTYTAGAQYGAASHVAVTDSANRTTRYAVQNYTSGYSSASRIVGIQRPADIADTTIVTYNDSNSKPAEVTSITRDGVTYSYSATDTYTGAPTGYLTVSGRTITRTNPAGAVVTYKAANFVANSGRVTSVSDGLSHQTTYTYDSLARLTGIIYPEGNSKAYTYDSRGNVLAITLTPKVGSALANMVVSASYSPTCTNVVTCNKPTAVTDPLGNITDYSYDPTHGGVLTATLPAGTAGGVRSQMRYGYSALQAAYKNSAGTIVNSGYPTYKLVSISECRSLSSCAGTADETLTTQAYAGNGSTNNLALTSQTVAAGDSSVSATTTFSYDDVGNKITVDGPLAGNADTLTYRYDADRELVGTIYPDPDGAGALKRRAQRATYNGNGMPTITEVGTVSGTSDGDWVNFTSVSQKTQIYDNNGRLTTITEAGGGATYRVTQNSYDSIGRLDCSTTRMNATAWASLPASACVAQTPGSSGVDRVSRYYYDANDRRIRSTIAYGTSDESNDESISYTANGKILSQTDANGNVTNYTYDGLDRRTIITFPDASYEQFTYDANSNFTSHRLRDGNSITYTYDNRNDVLTKTLPGTELGKSYSYDLFGHLVSVSRSDGQYINAIYDSLGRQISVTTPTSGAITAIIYVTYRRTESMQIETGRRRD